MIPETGFHICEIEGTCMQGVSLHCCLKTLFIVCGVHTSLLCAPNYFNRCVEV